MRTPRAPGPGPEREPRPPVRPGARGCSSRGATSRTGRSPRPARCSPGSRRRPTCSSPRRCATACSTGCGAAEVAAVVSCFTYERRGPDGDTADATAALAHQAGRRRLPAPRAALARPQRRRGRPPAPLDPAARPRVHARDVRVGPGRRPRRRARRRRDRAATSSATSSSASTCSARSPTSPRPGVARRRPAAASERVHPRGGRGREPGRAVVIRAGRCPGASRCRPTAGATPVGSSRWPGTTPTSPPPRRPRWPGAAPSCASCPAPTPTSPGPSGWGRGAGTGDHRRGLSTCSTSGHGPRRRQHRRARRRPRSPPVRGTGSGRSRSRSTGGSCSTVRPPRWSSPTASSCAAPTWCPEATRATAGSRSRCTPSRRAERRAMRPRLAGGDHVPHPRIAQASGRRVDGPAGTDRRGRRSRSTAVPLATAGRARDRSSRPGAVRVLI